MRTSAIIVTSVLMILAACGGDPTSPAAGTAAASRGGGDGTGTSSSGGSTSGGAAARVETRIALTPPTGAPYAPAKGKATFETRGSDRKLEVEVEHLPAGTAVTFFLGATQLGTGTTNSFGEAEVELETEHGATVPATVTGLVVEVRTSAGAVIVRGAF